MQRLGGQPVRRFASWELVRRCRVDHQSNRRVALVVEAGQQCTHISHMSGLQDLGQPGVLTEQPGTAGRRLPHLRGRRRTEVHVVQVLHRVGGAELSGGGLPDGETGHLGDGPSRRVGDPYAETGPGLVEGDADA